MATPARRRSYPSRSAASTALPFYDAEEFEVARAISEVLHDREFVRAADLLEPEYRDDPNAYAGHCYRASEAFYHLMGASKSGFKPRRVKLKHAVGSIPAGTRHWWLVDTEGNGLDLTGSQFPDGFPYELGVNGGWLTGDTPSKRARRIIERVLELHPHLRPSA